MNRPRQRPQGLRRRFARWLRHLPAPVWALAAIFGVGGLMCLFAAAFPISKTAPTTLATVLGIVLVCAAAALLRFGTAMSPRGLQVLAIAARWPTRSWSPTAPPTTAAR